MNSDLEVKKNNLPKKGGIKYFEERCKYYAFEEKSIRKKSAFLKRCRNAFAGTSTTGKWKEKEIETRLDILETYFPGEKARLLEYKKNEDASRANRERIKAEKEKLKELSIHK